MTRQKITFSRDNFIIVNGTRTDLYVRQGNYYGTSDDRAGRWYSGRDGDGFRPWGTGSRTRQEAAQSALDAEQLEDA